MAYIRKTYDEYEIWQDFGDGIEYACTAKDRKDARRLLREYRENQPQYPAMIKSKRIPVNARKRQKMSELT